MRATLWFLILFGMAVAAALFAGQNDGTVTLFWPPYRIDLSLNMAVLVLVAVFALLYGALRGLAAMTQLPHEARRWRTLQKERSMHAALLDALGQFTAGRYLRARKAAQAALAHEADLAATQAEVPHHKRLRALAHLIAAESAHALQDHAAREEHLQAALAATPAGGTSHEQEVREGIQLRAARWAQDLRDPHQTLSWLAQLPQGVARRTVALRLKLKATRRAGLTQEALDTARLLAKHRAFSPEAAQVLVRSLLTELLQATHDPAQLQRAWASLEADDRATPELALLAAQRMAALEGDPTITLQWLQPVWQAYLDQPGRLSASHAIALVRLLAEQLRHTDAGWLARIETAARLHPADVLLDYLAGIVCLHHQLWGKAQQHLQSATHQLQDPALRADAWRRLAELAEQRGDTAAAAQAWKAAAQATL